MHTVLINTSSQSFEHRMKLLDIQKERRKFLYFDCPFSSWFDEEKGYENSAARIGEMIDSYKDINNDYNLIIYVDLLGFEEYASIFNDTHLSGIEVSARIELMRNMVLHYVASTVYRSLNERGRVPRETVVVFEQNKHTSHTADGVQYSAIKADVALSLLGLPQKADVERINESITEDGEKGTEAFVAKVFEACKKPVVDGLLERYGDAVENALKDIRENYTVDRAFEELVRSIEETYKSESGYLKVVPFITNRRVGDKNKRERARRDLRLCFFIIECIEDYNKNGMEQKFPTLNWDAVAVRLYKKKLELKAQYDITSKVTNRYYDLSPKMAPQLKKLDHDRFALDEFGNKGVDFETRIVESAPEDKEKSAESAIADGVVKSTLEAEIVVSQKQTSNLFGEEKYKRFDYEGDAICDYELPPKPQAKDYCDAAEKMREHHIMYLKRLQANIKRILSKYAGRSLENDEAILKKRIVSAEHDFVDDKGVQSNYSNNQDEDDSLNNIREKAKKAYATLETEYLRFVAGRSVAITDIEEQGNWFVSRVKQIEESLSKIKTVTFGVLMGTLALYIPYIVIQWEGIFKNIVTMLTATCSIAIPIVLLYGVVFPIVYAKQLKMYKEEWDKFIEKSREAIAENAEAAREYDRLLSFYAPALRWVYEYKLDVDFYDECCQMAKAKLSHHTKKLFDCIETVDNIIEDLECDELIARDEAEKLTQEVKQDGKGIDYSYSFCGSAKNREFYSIIDGIFLREVQEKGEDE